MRAPDRMMGPSGLKQVLATSPVGSDGGSRGHGGPSAGSFLLRSTSRMGSRGQSCRDVGDDCILATGEGMYEPVVGMDCQCKEMYVQEFARPINTSTYLHHVLTI